MEWLPKAYDALDSAWFEMRMRFAALSARRSILFSALFVLFLLSPVFRSLTVAAIGAFLAAEWVACTLRGRTSTAAQRRRLATR
jgi:hypothetical protein